MLFASYRCFIGEIKLFFRFHQNSKWKWKIVQGEALYISAPLHFPHLYGFRYVKHTYVSLWCFVLNKSLSDQMNMCSFGLVNTTKFKTFPMKIHGIFIFFSGIVKISSQFFPFPRLLSFDKVCQVTN